MVDSMLVVAPDPLKSKYTLGTKEEALHMERR